MVRTTADGDVRVLTLDRPERRNALDREALRALEAAVELALAADVRVATPDATVAEPGVQLGLFGAWGGTTRLPRIIGEGEALDLALSGRTVDAETARRMGLVSRITDDPRAVVDHDALLALKRRLRDGSEQSVGDEDVE